MRQQRELNDRYVKGRQELLRMVDANKPDGAKAWLMKQLRPIPEACDKAITEQVAAQKELAEQDAAAAALAWWITGFGGERSGRVPGQHRRSAQAGRAWPSRQA